MDNFKKIGTSFYKPTRGKTFNILRKTVKTRNALKRKKLFNLFFLPD